VATSGDTIDCRACGTANDGGRKFCGECGSPLALVCGSCGTPNTAGAKFCGECGARLVADAAPAVAAVAPQAPASAAERRLVSVLFADLVGFTTLSEGRDAEDTRELLTGYFETARRVIERYGGSVEKFIGDAVMAVWGAPLANEDDAERAVRAALDLVSAVPELDAGLRARVGVLTGEAAVTLGAVGQGMVAGDLVNTASRIQSAAEPGTVLVGESTKRATEAAVAYAPAGEHELKGKVDRLQLFRALRVTAGRGGALKSVGIEPPFVGRERELRIVKELFHASADERQAQLVSVIGIPGIGKSRLAWEFFKYMDGLTELVWWHRGRCLAYGDGVAFWALAEMVRMRGGILEGEEPASTRAKLRAMLEQHVPDPDERRFVEPRLAHLLALDDTTPTGNEDLFSAWRLLFERMAEHAPVALLFEDLQWADAALVEFIDHLLEWSRGLPIFVICLARPELQQRHPGFGHGSRSQTTLYLDPLAEAAMEQLLDGFVPGLPDELRRRILTRAEGVPLYAVETVRMLLDRGLLEEQDDAYRPTQAIEELDVPETLLGLIAARLDGLSPEERGLLQDAAVLGKTFFAQGLAAVSGKAVEELESMLAGLVRKEVLGVQTDPRSPERGQYGFLQDLVRRVAYDTLSRRDRRARHLAAASYLEESAGAEQEVVEVVAAHYVSAFEAQPDADDAEAVMERAGALLVRAGERAASLGAVGEARRHFEQAAELARSDADRALLLERAGRMASMDAALDAAADAFERSRLLLEAAGELRAAARVSARLATVEARRSQHEQATDRLERAYAVLSADGVGDADVAEVASLLAVQYVFSGELERAEEPNERALEIAQGLRLSATLARALNTKAMLQGTRGRPEEQLALMRHALRYAVEHDELERAGVACGNLSDACFMRDLYAEALEVLDQGLEIARRSGDRGSERYLTAERSYALALRGAWDEALALCDDVAVEDELRSDILSLASGPLETLVQRGRLDDARALLERFRHLEGSVDTQDSSMLSAAEAAVAFAEGSHAAALRLGTQAFDYAAVLGAGSQGPKHGFVWAAEAALALGDRTRAAELARIVERLPPGLRPPFLEAQAHRVRARLDGDPQHFKAAAAIFRDFDLPFWLAVAQLEHAELTAASGDLGEAAVLSAEARAIFARLEATPWLERTDALTAPLTRS
jgi:predicted ATPase/class 3 adenylate cyclase